jgi:hypothetical protein
MKKHANAQDATLVLLTKAKAKSASQKSTTKPQERMTPSPPLPPPPSKAEAKIKAKPKAPVPAPKPEVKTSTKGKSKSKKSAQTDADVNVKSSSAVVLKKASSSKSSTASKSKVTVDKTEDETDKSKSRKKASVSSSSSRKSSTSSSSAAVTTAVVSGEEEKEKGDKIEKRQSGGGGATTSISTNAAAAVAAAVAVAPAVSSSGGLSVANKTLDDRIYECIQQRTAGDLYEFDVMDRMITEFLDVADESGALMSTTSCLARTVMPDVMFGTDPINDTDKELANDLPYFEPCEYVACVTFAYSGVIVDQLNNSSSSSSSASAPVPEAVPVASKSSIPLPVSLLAGAMEIDTDVAPPPLIRTPTLGSKRYVPMPMSIARTPPPSIGMSGQAQQRIIPHPAMSPTACHQQRQYQSAQSPRKRQCPSSLTPMLGEVYISSPQPVESGQCSPGVAFLSGSPYHHEQLKNRSDSACSVGSDTSSAELPFMSMCSPPLSSYGSDSPMPRADSPCKRQRFGYTSFSSASSSSLSSSASSSSSVSNAPERKADDITADCSEEPLPELKAITEKGVNKTRSGFLSDARLPTAIHGAFLSVNCRVRSRTGRVVFGAFRQRADGSIAHNMQWKWHLLIRNDAEQACWEMVQKRTLGTHVQIDNNTGLPTGVRLWVWKDDGPRCSPDARVLDITELIDLTLTTDVCGCGCEAGTLTARFAAICSPLTPLNGAFAAEDASQSSHVLLPHHILPLVGSVVSTQHSRDKWYVWTTGATIERQFRHAGAVVVSRKVDREDEETKDDNDDDDNDNDGDDEQDGDEEMAGTEEKTEAKTTKKRKPKKGGSRTHTGELSVSSGSASECEWKRPGTMGSQAKIMRPAIEYHSNRLSRMTADLRSLRWQNVDNERNATNMSQELRLTSRCVTFGGNDESDDSDCDPFGDGEEREQPETSLEALIRSRLLKTKPLSDEYTHDVVRVDSVNTHTASDVQLLRQTSVEYTATFGITRECAIPKHIVPVQPTTAHVLLPGHDLCTWHSIDMAVVNEQLDITQPDGDRIYLSPRLSELTTVTGWAVGRFYNKPYTNDKASRSSSSSSNESEVKYDIKPPPLEAAFPFVQQNGAPASFVAPREVLGVAYHASRFVLVMHDRILYQLPNGVLRCYSWHVKHGTQMAVDVGSHYVVALTMGDTPESATLHSWDVQGRYRRNRVTDQWPRAKAPTHSEFVLDGIQIRDAMLPDHRVTVNVSVCFRGLHWSLRWEARDHTIDYQKLACGWPYWRFHSAVSPSSFVAQTLIVQTTLMTGDITREYMESLVGGATLQGLCGSLHDRAARFTQSSRASIVAHIASVSDHVMGREQLVYVVRALIVRLHMCMWPSRLPIVLDMDNVAHAIDLESYVDLLQMPELGLTACVWDRRQIVFERHDVMMEPHPDNFAAMLCIASAIDCDAWTNLDTPRVVPHLHSAEQQQLQQLLPPPPELNSVAVNSDARRLADTRTDSAIREALDAYHEAAIALNPVVRCNASMYARIAKDRVQSIRRQTGHDGSSTTAQVVFEAELASLATDAQCDRIVASNRLIKRLRQRLLLQCAQIVSSDQKGHGERWCLAVGALEWYAATGEWLPAQYTTKNTSVSPSADWNDTQRDILAGLFTGARNLLLRESRAIRAETVPIIWDVLRAKQRCQTGDCQSFDAFVVAWTSLADIHTAVTICTAAKSGCRTVVNARLEAALLAWIADAQRMYTPRPISYRWNIEAMQTVAAEGTMPSRVRTWFNSQTTLVKNWFNQLRWLCRKQLWNAVAAHVMAAPKTTIKEWRYMMGKLPRHVDSHVDGKDVWRAVDLLAANSRGYSTPTIGKSPARLALHLVQADLESLTSTGVLPDYVPANIAEWLLSQCPLMPRCPDRLRLAALKHVRFVDSDYVESVVSRIREIALFQVHNFDRDLPEPMLLIPDLHDDDDAVLERNSTSAPATSMMVDTDDAEVVDCLRPTTVNDTPMITAVSSSSSSSISSSLSLSTIFKSAHRSQFSMDIDYDNESDDDDDIEFDL